jgi:hypothetical protein
MVNEGFILFFLSVSLLVLLFFFVKGLMVVYLYLIVMKVMVDGGG